MLLGDIFKNMKGYIPGKYYRVPCLVKVLNRPVEYEKRFINKSTEELARINTIYQYTPLKKKSVLPNFYIMDDRFISIDQDHLPVTYMFQYDEFPNSLNYDRYAYIYLKCKSYEGINH